MIDAMFWVKNQFKKNKRQNEKKGLCSIPAAIERYRMSPKN